MKLTQKTKKEFLINFLFFLAILGSIYVICRFLFQYLLPFVIATIIAWAVQKPSRYIGKKTGINRMICAPVLAAALYLIVLSLFVLFLYIMISTSGGLIESVPKIFSEASTFFENLQSALILKFDEMPESLISSIDKICDSTVNSFFASVAGIISGSATFVARKMPSFLVGTVISVVAACYIAKDYMPLTRFLQGMCGKKIYKNILKIKIIFVESIWRFVKGYALLMIITFVELCSGLLFLKVKYAPLLAVIISFIDILPVLGTGTVLVPWGIFEIALYDKKLGLGILVLYAVITIIRNFLEPKIIGKQLGINPLFTLLTMFVGIKLFGLVGMVIIPIAFIVVVKYYKNEMEQDNYCDI